MSTDALDRFLLVAARFKLDMAASRDVVDAAAELVTDEPESDDGAAVEISVLSIGDVRRAELLPLVDQVLTEHDQVPLNAEGAAEIVARDMASSVSGGLVEPREGAGFLWRLARAVPEEDQALAVFIHLATEWDDIPEQRDEIENEIRSEASKLLRKRVEHRGEVG